MIVGHDIEFMDIFLIWVILIEVVDVNIKDR